MGRRAFLDEDTDSSLAGMAESSGAVGPRIVHFASPAFSSCHWPRALGSGVTDIPTISPPTVRIFPRHTGKWTGMGLAPGSAWSLPHCPGWHGREEGSRAPRQAGTCRAFIKRQSEGKEAGGGGRKKLGWGSSCLGRCRWEAPLSWLCGTCYVVLLHEVPHLPMSMYLLPLCLLSIEEEEDIAAFPVYPPGAHFLPCFLQLCLFPPSLIEMNPASCFLPS
ncbi:hypothetical protein LX32DRAFT_442923 [Colletotrichum zoysiae]|uniref:Uncharacterized protein n=1 Tax=Colletotrichum zoysiae TaxID=1216348 RepID=A0AAD9M4I4_9PEZI|nr:hypothetical protein LX32DRAFT_442923 [Colletotrichum zoysiae]